MSEPKTPSGFSLNDTREIYEHFNRVALALGGADVPVKTIVKRLRIVSGWLTQAADDLAGISAEEAAHMDVERFWRARRAGERGEDADA